MDLDEEQLYRTIGRRLRERRDSMGVSQGRLAKQVGILRTSVTNIEAGRQRPPVHLLYRLALALNIDVPQLLPDIRELAKPSMVTVEIDGAPPQVPPRTAEVLRRIWEEDDGSYSGN